MITNQYLLGATCVALSAILFGIQPIFGAKLQLLEVDPLALNAIRYAVPACLLLLLFGSFRKSLKFSDALRHGWLGVGFAGAGMGYYQAGYSIGFGLTVILFFSFPIFVGLYSAVILKIRTTSIQMIMMLISTLGLVIAIDTENMRISSLIGVFWAFFAALCYAAVLLYRGHGAPPIGEYLSLTALMVASTSILLPLAWLANAQFPTDFTAWSWAISLAIISGIVPIGLVMVGSRLIGAIDTATLCVIEPIVAVMASIIIIHETAPPSTICGGFLVLSAAIFLVRSQHKNSQLEKPMG